MEGFRIDLKRFMGLTPALNRAGRYCYFGITIDIKATIIYMNTVQYLQLLMRTMLHIPSGNLGLTCTVITLRLCYGIHTFMNG